MKHLYPVLASLCIFLHGCTFTYRSPVENNLSATVIKSTSLPAVPSGSALELMNDALYIISDDARYIYRCAGENGVLMDSLRLLHLAGAERRIPKPVKPDYEAAIAAMVDGKDCLIAFGSGSMALQRDSAVIITLGDSGAQQVVALNTLYAALRKEAGIDEADFNIEAAALQENRLVLINRGTNHLFSMDWDKILKHLREAAPVPPVSVSVVPLPEKSGYPTGISGACFLDDDRLLFCASVEATTNWVEDGEVLGSYIGVIALDKSGKGLLQGLAPVMTDEGRPIKDKIEGISGYGEIEKGMLTVLGIVDNDDGSSALLRIRLKNLPSP